MSEKKAASNWLKERPLGEAMRLNYQATLNEEVPDKLLKLVSKLNNGETKN